MSKRGKTEFQTKRQNAQENKETTSEVDHIDERRFSKDLTQLIKESEELRLDYMRRHQMRNWVSLNLSILFVLAGAGVFGWYFMMEAQVVMPFFVLIASFLPTIFLNIWAGEPLKAYARVHKREFMPKMAKALGGLSYHPSRGVSAKMINKLAVVPAYDRYDAEDCFMGNYKGMKVILSEARLYTKARKDAPVFNGLFVLLEAPEDVFEGHTIITSNDKMVNAYASTRWKTMSPVNVMVSEASWDRFKIYSTKPDAAAHTVNERLLKELAEAGDVFDKAPITAVLFKKRYIFMMIPHDKDMFEASGLFVPVTTRDQALRVKKEIEQLLEVVDVFDLYYYNDEDKESPAVAAVPPVETSADDADTDDADTDAGDNSDNRS